MQSGPLDPYSGDRLAWELIGTWDPNADHSENYAPEEFIGFCAKVARFRGLRNMDL
jgi:hypothetical protein